MKLVNRLMAGQKLSFASGVVTVDAEGVVEVEDKAAAEALARSGFKPAFARKEPKAEPKPEVRVETAPEAPKAAEPLSTSKVDHKKKGK